MSHEEAKEYADIVVETLVEWGIVSNSAYGHMTEAQRDELADLLVRKSQE